MKRWCATFDLNKYAASWMFLQFLINAEMAKPEGHQLVVEIKKAPLKYRPGGRLPQDSINILANVILPSIELIGAVRAEDGERGIHVSQFHVDTIVAAHAGKKIPKWKVPPQYMREAAEYLTAKSITGAEYRRNPIVITLRECGYWPGRNSNLKAWKKFALSTNDDVIFVRDTAKADEPMHGFNTCPRASKDLLFRAALMMQARANLLVANGPCVLPWFSDVPFLNFRQLCPEHPDWGAGRPEYWINNGLFPGDQLPWCKPTQRLTWCDDEYKNIEREWRWLSKLLRKETVAA